MNNSSSNSVDKPKLKSTKTIVIGLAIGLFLGVTLGIAIMLNITALSPFEPNVDIHTSKTVDEEKKDQSEKTALSKLYKLSQKDISQDLAISHPEFTIPMLSGIY